MIKIAVLKPHHGPVGGFERVVNRVSEILTGAGYDLTRHTVDLTDVDAVARTRPLDRLVIDDHREFLTYLHGRDRFDGLSTGVYDLVISTSPPSYVHRHRAHLALFFHHHRVFYDLEAPYLAAGFATDADAHARAAGLVRSLDHDRLAAVTTFLCPSTTVAGRLERFNQRTDTMPFHAGTGITPRSVTDRGGAAPLGSGVLCVTRHEFPKRAELVVAAAHLLETPVAVTCTGTGGRLAFTRDLDARLTVGAVHVDELDDAALWCNTGAPPAAPTGPGGRVDFVGHVDDRTLEEYYATARCVVAPAYDEDYGLTAIEAMHHGCPVIVCRDGGGLAELVDDGETGLVVEPTPAAIAAAVDRLHADDDLATRLGRNGRDRAAGLSWARAADQLLTAVEATLDTAA